MLSKHLLSHSYEMEPHSGSKPISPASRRHQVSMVSRKLVLILISRYFDIRLEAVGEGEDREWRVLHCLMGAKLRGLLLEVRQFLDDHMGEVVILDIQHTYCFSQSDHAELASFLLSTFRHLLVPYEETLTVMPSLEALQRKDTRVVIIYPPVAPCCSLLWPRKGCPTPWPDTTDTSKLRWPNSPW